VKKIRLHTPLGGKWGHAPWCAGLGSAISQWCSKGGNWGHAPWCVGLGGASAHFLQSF